MFSENIFIPEVARLQQTPEFQISYIMQILPVQMGCLDGETTPSASSSAIFKISSRTKLEGLILLDRKTYEKLQ